MLDAGAGRRYALPDEPGCTSTRKVGAVRAMLIPAPRATS